MELAALSGLHLDEWQQLVLRGGLGQRAGKKWAASKVGCWVPRQNGKGGIIEARVLAGLVLLKEPLIVWTAHLFTTAQEGFLRIRALVESTPDLHKRVKPGRGGYKTGALGMGIEFKPTPECPNGQRLRFLARKGGAGRGFTAPCLILDEAQELDSNLMAAIQPTMSALPRSQMWMFGTPPTDTEAWCYGLRDDGEAGRERLAWFDWGAKPGLREEAWADRDLWYATNPAMGIRIQEETVEDELGPSGLGDKFPHERLGLWRPRGVGGIIDPDRWKDLEDPESKRAADVAVAFDISPERDWGAVAIYGPRVDELGHSQLVDYRRGTQWIVARLIELRGTLNPIAFAVGRGSFAALETELTAAGFVQSVDPERPGRGDLVVLTSIDMAAACGQLIDAVRQGTLRQVPNQHLDAAVFGAKIRHVGDTVAWARREVGADITPLVSVTLARWAYVSRPVPKRVKAQVW